jgi:predicted RNase H-like nuclease (RuvC/YqgF family)
MTDQQLDELRDLIRGEAIAEILRYYQGEDSGDVFAQESLNDERWEDFKRKILETNTGPRIEELEGEMCELRYRVNNAEGAIENLQWRNENG